ncbi:MAG: LysE family translocator [Anaerolineae bacterium]
MEITSLLQGILLGFSIAAPVGPIGILCIRRTLSQGRVAGLVSGLGAATADACYGSIAGFGLGFLSTLLVEASPWLNLIGGLFLCFLGITTFLARPATPQDLPASTLSLGSAYFSTLLLTLSNPMTILSFAAIYAGMGAITPTAGHGQSVPPSSVTLVAGVFVGSALWWLGLSAIVDLVRQRFSTYWLRWTNQISGLILLAYGVLGLIHVSF